jgi:glyoxylase-like metal-dependent hydrolase (beta-lactamase superfamily II)
MSPVTSTTTIMGETPGDLAVRAYGIVRLAVPVPFAEAGGAVNIYLIDNGNGSLTLFDAGIGTPAAREALAAGFVAAGRRLEDVRQILVSHGHIDHYGGARPICERAGATVRVHPRDASKLTGRRDAEDWAAAYGRYFARLDVPPEQTARVTELYRGQRRLAERLDDAAPLAAGERLTFGAFAAEVIHTPGHTPGHVCLHAPEARLLFTGDHLLAAISPNPLLELGPHGEVDKFRALSAYLDSVRLVEGLEADWILPGHGEPFTGHRQVIARLRAFHDKRQAKVLNALAAGPRTAYELVRDLFGRTDAAELFLMLSEVVGNLEVLEDRGAVQRNAGEDVLRWSIDPRAAASTR